MHGIVDHEFFTNGTVPSQIPRSAHEKAPDFRHISRTVSKLNLERLRRKAMLDNDGITGPVNACERIYK